MHASLQHSFGGSTGADEFGPFPQSWTPTTYLLKGGDLNLLCLTCHDDNGAPDVLANNTGPLNTNRSAGALNRDDMVVDSYEKWMGHSLYSTDTAPGEAGSFVPDAVDGLACTDCHQQHGYAGFGTVDVANNPIDSVMGTYRNLVAANGLGVSYAISNNDLTKDVYEDFGMAYNTDFVNLNEPNPDNSGFGEWCQSCHINFHGQVGDTWIGGSGTPPTHFVRHPNAGVNIGAVGGGHSSLDDFSAWAYRVRVMSPGGVWGMQGTPWGALAPNDLTPTCLSCHKAHGNKNAFGLIYAKGDAALGEQGDGTSATELCQQCHVQGG
jgi:hypothetical protein